MHEQFEAIAAVPSGAREIPEQRRHARACDEPRLRRTGGFIHHVTVNTFISATALLVILWSFAVPVNYARELRRRPLKQFASVKPVSNERAGDAVNPPSPAGQSTSRLKMESSEGKLVVRAQLPGQGDWVELATYVMEPNSRPYLHPVRDASGRVVLTEDRPADHPWQHGIFTGFHRVNGFNYWKEDEGKQRFVRLLDLKEASDRVTWRALVELVAPDGSVVLEEEDAITIHAPESPDAYVIDFDLLAARERTGRELRQILRRRTRRAHAVGQSQSAPDAPELERTARPGMRTTARRVVQRRAPVWKRNLRHRRFRSSRAIRIIPPAGAPTSRA